MFLDHPCEVVEPLLLKGDPSSWNEDNGRKAEGEGLSVLAPEGEVEKNRVRSVIVVPGEKNLLHVCKRDLQADHLLVFLLGNFKRDTIPFDPELTFPSRSLDRESSIVVGMARFRNFHI